MTESQIIDRLAERHAAPAWAFFPHLRNQTGYGLPIRTVDAVAMSLYPSRGLYLHGFEIKTDRTDWLRELKNPEKADDFAQHLDFFSVVTPPDIVRKGEVPATWGHIVVKGKTLHYAQPSERLTHEDSKLSREIVASLLRRAHESREASPGAVALREAQRKGREEGAETFTKMQEQLVAHGKFEAEKLLGRIKRFEEGSGINIDSWESDKIGDAVQTLLRADIDFSQIGPEIERMETQTAHVDMSLKHLRTLYAELGKRINKKPES